MIEKVQTLWPEIALFAATCIVMVVGLSPSRNIRRLSAVFGALGLASAGVLAWMAAPNVDGALPNLARYGKTMTAAVGLLLLLLSTGTVDRDYEEQVELSEKRGRTGVFDAIRSNRAEFYSFFLFSLTGLMLCAGANDLIWLFLALELTSLPTYVMVAISTARERSLEAAVKYFFLGALGAAIFLFGFVFLYGATGTTVLFSGGGEPGIAQVLASQMGSTGGAGLSGLAIAGLILSVIGVCFKIAAVPMHFYTPDVYQGASATVAAFLAFVPKTAGFFTLMLLVSLCSEPAAGADGWVLPQAIRLALWAIAAATMTVGNVLAILQTSVKRILAYSSIAHSGYMLVGLLAGPSAEFRRSGLAAVLFYLLCYGVMNLGAFGVLACLERRRPDGTHEEIDDIEDLRGLCKTQPALGWVMVICSVGLLGLPPFLGFMGKLPLFTAGISAGEIPLVVVLGINSAIAAYYYLRLAGYALLENPAAGKSDVVTTPFPTRIVAALCSAVGVVLLSFLAAGPLTDQAALGAKFVPAIPKGFAGAAPSLHSNQAGPVAAAGEAAVRASAVP